MNDIWSLTIPAEKGPVVAVALHDGHRIRDALLPLLTVDEPTRLREEDPGTGAWTAIGDVQIVATRSRFETDLNRSRERAVYLSPEDAWGIPLWRSPLPQRMHAESLALYDRFYAFLRELLADLERRFGCFVLYDLHAYNHRRGGPAAPCEPALTNPEVNIGTGTMDRARWAPLVDALSAQLQSFNFDGRRLDVRENIRFQGGELARFVHTHFPQSGCALSIEFKKFWMDEWSGAVDAHQHALIRQALQTTVPIVREALHQCG